MSDNAHIDKRFDEIMNELQKIHGAFPRGPDGDIDHSGHRQYHEDMIRAAQAQEQFWHELRLDIAKKGVWGLIIVVCGLVTIGLLAKMGLYK
jgi:hypothetical protein